MLGFFAQRLTCSCYLPLLCLTASVYSLLSDGFDVVPRAIEPVVVVATAVRDGGAWLGCCVYSL